MYILVSNRPALAQKDRTRSFTIGITANKSPEFKNPEFVKELEELREILRSSQLSQSTKVENINPELSLNEAQEMIKQLQSKLDEATIQQEKLNSELRIERNLRLDLEKVNRQQAEKITELEAQQTAQA